MILSRGSSFMNHIQLIYHLLSLIVFLTFIHAAEWGPPERKSTFQLTILSLAIDMSFEVIRMKISAVQLPCFENFVPI